MRAVWIDKKKRKRDVWESQREESKQARINDTQTSFFPLFCGRRRERSEPSRRKKKNPLHCENQMMGVKKSSRKVKAGSSWKCI